MIVAPMHICNIKKNNVLKYDMQLGLIKTNNISNRNP